MTQGNETVVRIRATGTGNRHGESTGAPDRKDIAGCVVWPRGSSETGELVVIDGYGVWAPPTDIAVDLKATDRIECRGTVWDIDGTPGDFRKKSGERKGILIMLKKAGT